MRKPVMHSIWLVLVLSALSSSASAGTIGDLTYEIADGEVTIADCDEAARGELVIPAAFEDLPVISIGFEAFIGCSNLTSIIIPDGGVAFYACYSIADSASQVPKWDNSHVGDS